MGFPEWEEGPGNEKCAYERGRGKKRRTVGLGRSRVTSGNTQYFQLARFYWGLGAQNCSFFSSLVLPHLSLSITHPFDSPGPNYKLSFSFLFLSDPPNGTETAKGLGVICLISGVKGKRFLGTK